jgi:glutathione synthase
MPTICFLTSTRGVAHNDNHARLPRAFDAAGWTVTRADHDDVRLDVRGVCVGAAPLGEFDLIWPIGLGTRATFLDRMQLLSTLDERRFVTSPRALLMQHAKYALALGDLAAHHPHTVASRDPRWLKAVVVAGGEWIAKPPAASFGRDVYRVHAADSNLDVILDSLTGHDGSRYCLLQRYVAEIERGETRVLLADAEVIGAYLRAPGTDHRANLSGDGRALPVEPSAAELELARAVAQRLIGHGIRFVAVDLAYPWIIEFNVANPGGLGTIERITGVDLAPRVVATLGRGREAVAAGSGDRDAGVAAVSSAFTS